jgi:AraC-like DNA-binding protein
MASRIITIETISQLHEMLGYGKPRHPLVTVMDPMKIDFNHGLFDYRVASSLYSVWLKTGHCGMNYGRSHYDFEEGVLFFTAPQQVVSSSGPVEPKAGDWMLFFHPDLIRKTSLGAAIHQYSFFSYETNEALHLSDEEKDILTRCVKNIEEEYSQRIDDHSQNVIVSNIELLLSYSTRYYSRQFNTRTTRNKDILTQFESLLKQYFESDELVLKGLPSAQHFADQVHLSANYLSDLLKKESGRSIKDHINDFAVEKAKYQLLSSDDTISGIAYSLGFNYPHYFSRLFKAKTGLSPNDYRNSHLKTG